MTCCNQDMIKFPVQCEPTCVFLVHWPLRMTFDRQYMSEVSLQYEPSDVSVDDQLL